ncbi:glycosyltransferase [Acidicapsa ligni]|uniref:glycosyltransferase n=1 Tax=Acidicapsa ligni TaxID=542300 RepID=UPI0021E02B07|nr:glycosyltransferase [Acidicapsa ligni]
MLLFLLALGSFGLLTSSVFAGLVLAGTRHHLRNQPSPGKPSFTPPLSLLKPLHGIEPDLEDNLATFFEQDYPSSNFEILFCAADQRDPGLEIARHVAARYPQVSTRFYSTGEPKYINAKVHSLEVMTAAAANSILVISDSDVRVTPDYLRAVAAPFTDPQVGAMTCLYRGVATQGGIWARLEATGMSVEMTAGVLVANLLEGMKFVLGPTMAVRRECVEQMGPINEMGQINEIGQIDQAAPAGGIALASSIKGIGVLGDYCSDDYLLGNSVFQQGHTVVLSHHAIDHIILNESFTDSLQHQVRWMKSTRFSRPKGHFGTALTFSMPFALLALFSALALGHPILAASLFTWGILTRLAIAWAAGRLVVHDESSFGLFMLYPIRDLMGFGFWAASYVSSRILWRGRVYQLLSGGRMKAAD